MLNKRFFTYLLFCLAFPFTTGAVEPEIAKNIDKGMRAIFPEFEATSITESKIKGLYEVMQGAEIFYVTGDGHYILEGNLFDLKNKQNLTEAQRSIARTSMLKDLATDEYIEFTPDQTKHTIYVFTDTDCAYCRRFHSQISEVNKLGIAVRYLAFPRAGEDSSTFTDMESVWCSKNRNQALTGAKLGRKPVLMKCSNPVSRQFHLGQQIGVRGTPALFTENGKYIGGYLTPEELVQAITDAY
ncbi:MAG: Thiol:disulfide interchange protein [Gammaproteobacteria bacterium]|nr:Thiol:disulfide interchange protein [Gammaproteobacteria bacterium]